MAAYLQAAIDDGDPALLAAALGDVAKARGMAQLARDTGLSRESLYKSLSGERAPSSETLFKVLHALGLKITLSPIASGS
jgi:probable addiction module antidote protein